MLENTSLSKVLPKKRLLLKIGFPKKIHGAKRKGGSIDAYGQQTNGERASLHTHKTEKLKEVDKGSDKRK
jgi:phage tail tube protein FII